MGIAGIRQTLIILLAALLIGAVTTHVAAEETAGGASNQPGLAAPHADSKGRAGTWWWPRSGGDDVKGNRGRVFSRRDATPTPEVKAEMEPPPPPHPGNMVVCGTPVIILNNLLFSGDSAVLKPEAKAECDKLAGELLKFTGDTLVLVGHTDDSGSAEYNLKLGEHRAQAAKDYIVSKGIAPERIGIRSMGETQPAVPNDSPANRALNRRVVFEIKLGN